MPYTLTIALPGKSVNTASLSDGVYIIGRGEGATLRLRHPEVSEQHARLTLSGGTATIEDLGSSNGTMVDNRPVVDPVTLSPDSLVSLGSCMLRVETGGGEAQTPPPPAVEKASAPPPPPPPPPPAPKIDPNAAVRREVKNQIHSELIQRLDLKRMTSLGIGAEDLQKKATETLHQIIGEVRQRNKLPAFINPDELLMEIYNEAMRLGPIEGFLADDSISEIMINGPDKVYVERGGRIELTGQTFMDDESVGAVIERIVAPIGRRIDESQPYVDARLADGSRVNAIIPPLSLIGPCVTIRKFSRRTLTAEDFIRFGTWTQAAVQFLDVCVRLRKNIIVAGGTGSGKTTLLNVLSSFIPPTDRILTIEDAAELRLNQPHVIRLEARPPNIEGRGAVTIRDLVRNALRMRPDRIIVGECRGGESLDMLQAMNTGHDGSLTTVHANSPRDVISRLETMVLMSGMELPSRAIREQIASAVDIVVHESRLSDGSRKVVCISEVVGLEGNQIVMQDLFEFVQSGVDPAGKILGAFRPTGAMPTFFDQLAIRGMSLDPAIFNPDLNGA